MFDTLIHGGRLIDGSGTPAVPGDLALSGDRVAAIGRLGSAEAKSHIDATGLAVAPG